MSVERKEKLVLADKRLEEHNVISHLSISLMVTLTIVMHALVYI